MFFEYVNEEQNAKSLISQRSLLELAPVAGRRQLIQTNAPVSLSKPSYEGCLKNLCLHRKEGQHNGKSQSLAKANHGKHIFCLHIIGFEICYKFAILQNLLKRPTKFLQLCNNH